MSRHDIILRQVEDITEAIDDILSAIEDREPRPEELALIQKLKERRQNLLIQFRNSP
jgi:hypothetical protein